MNFFFSGMGMATCLTNAQTSCAAARAGIVKLTPLDKLPAAPGEMEPVSLTGFQYPCLSGFRGISRLAQLCYRALKDLAETNHQSITQPSKVILQIPFSRNRLELEEQCKNQDEDITSLVQKALLQLVKADTHTERVVQDIQIIIGEPAEFSYALKLAYEYFNKESGKSCIVGSVDSLIDDKTIEYLMARELILTPDSTTGFFPGEAASFLYVTSEPTTTTIGKLTAIEYSQEEYEYFQEDSEEPPEDSHDKQSDSHNLFHGRTYSNVITSAFTKSGLDDDNHWDVYFGFNEHPASRDIAIEWGNVLVKLKDTYKSIDKIEWQNPQATFGGIGIATIPVLISLGLHSFLRGYAKSNGFLVTCASESGGRTALVINYAQ